MKSLVIGVSGISAADNPGPGIGIARSLKEDKDLNLKIIGLAYDALEPGIYMDWLIDQAFTVPYPSGSGEGFLERLRVIKKQTGMQCMIPNLDAELPLYIRYADDLKKMGIRVLVPTMNQFKLRSKDQLVDLAKKMKIKAPPTKVVHNDEQFAVALRTFGFPVIVKGVFYEAFKAYTEAEAYKHYRSLSAKWGFPIIVQQLVTGDELNVVGLGDGEGATLGLVGMKKMSVTSIGKVWSAVSIKHDAMLSAAKRFVKAFEWRGPFELECMVSQDDVYLIEINPRFPAWVYFATGVGVNLPSRMVRKMFDLPLGKTPSYAAGKMFMRYTYEIVTEMDRFQQIMTVGNT